MIALSDDFADLLVELADAGADFVVVGGFAVSFHGHTRATKDLDIFVRPHQTNSTRVFAALASFGAPISMFEIREDDFADYEGIVQLGLPPNRIDIITRIDGVGFDEAVTAGDAFEIRGRTVPVIGRAALLKNKQASGRPQDLADVAALVRRKHQGPR